ncbi:TonB-dependent receptor plug domain-containing protein [Rheinheimera tilapiae]|uniref:TonB-dependent receptor plug domain-containing protein n=1 Tax=Rheinheimera tilapiae TaxID=875043 RepID=A0ABV6BFC9_9GAMM
MRFTPHSLTLLASAITVATPAIATPAAENIAAENKVERIQVTGSFIKRSQQEDATPLLQIDADAIAASGKVTLTEVLRDLSVNSGNSFDEQYTGSFSAGSASIGLRGLSPKNTLVLVNGQRLSNYGFALNTQDTFVDLNALPLSAVKRIEVLKDGASSVYGSDAIAGVVNIILKEQITDTELSLSTGRATQGGLEQYGLGLSTGIGEVAQDGYNLSLTLDWFDRARLDASDRDLLKTGDFRHLPGGKLAGWSAQGANSLANPSLPQALTNCPVGSAKRPWSDFTPGRKGEVCAFNAQPFNTLQPEVTRRQLSLQGTVALGENLTGFAEWLYSDNDSAMLFGAPLTVGSGLRAYNPLNGTLSDIPVLLPVNHPDNSLATSSGKPLAIEYTFFDLGARTKANSQQFSRLLTGLKYQGDVWDAQVQLLQSFSHQREYVDNFVNRYEFEKVLQDGSYRFDGRENSAEVLNRLRLQTRRPGEYEINSLNGNASRDLWDNDYGTVAIATGFDLRKERMDAGTSPQVLSGTELRPAINLVKGERTVSAAFAELSLPLYTDLTASIAGRLDHYNDFGRSFSPKAGVHYVLAEDWLLRASWSRGFRAPSLPEIADSNTISYGTVIDPKDPLEPGSRRGYTQVRGGNPLLQPERSTNSNAGVIWSFSKQGSVGVDVFSIEQQDIIAGDSAQYVVDHPELYADRILRDAQGRLQILKNQYTNQGSRDTRGIDIDFNYRFELSNGHSLSLKTVWSHLLDYKQALVAGQPVLKGAGNNQFGALPAWKSNNSLIWQHSDWQASLTAAFSSGYQQKVATTASNPGLHNDINSFTQWDSQLSYRGIANTQISFAVQNLLDRDPPFDPSASSDYTDTTQYNLRGRQISLTASYQF